MSRGDLTGSDARAISGINLMLAVFEELEKLKDDLTTLSNDLPNQKKALDGHVQRVKAIMSTAGDRFANQNLIDALSELSFELSDEFPHLDTIQYLTHRVMKCFYDAIGAHYQKWESLRQSSITKALGSHVILDEPKLFRPSVYRKENKKKKLRFKEEETYALEDMTDEDDLLDDDYE